MHQDDNLTDSQKVAEQVLNHWASGNIDLEGLPPTFKGYDTADFVESLSNQLLTKVANMVDDAEASPGERLMDTLVDEWEDALAEVDMYLNKKYRHHVAELVDAMKRAITINSTFRLVTKYDNK